MNTPETSNKNDKNLFTELWNNVQNFLHDIESLDLIDVVHMENQISLIRKNIQWLIREALIKNFRKSEDVRISVTKKMVTGTTNTNKYANILSTNPKDSNHIQKNLIAYATKGKIIKSLTDLEKLFDEKKKEISDREEIMNFATYDEILALLDIEFIKIQKKILSFEKISEEKDSFNRIGYVLYYLWMKLWHTCRVFGNDHEVYIYDEQINKTIICSNDKGYQTYIADGEKNIFTIIKAALENEFTIIPFTNQEDRSKRIKDIWLGIPTEEKKPENLPEDKTDKVNEKNRVKRKYTRQEKITFTEKVIENVEDTKTELLSTFSAEDEFLVSESEKMEAKELSKKSPEEYAAMVESLKIGYKEFMELDKPIVAENNESTAGKKEFDGKKFMEYMKPKNLKDFPNRLSSLHKYFGKTPYIWRYGYTEAMLTENIDAIKDEEKKIRDDRDKDSMEQKNQDLKEILIKYFAFSDKDQKNKFIQENGSDFMKNLNTKATLLGWLPIGNLEYIKSIVENDLEKRFQYEKEYVKTNKMWVYSKVCSDLLAECKKNNGTLQCFPEFLKNYNKPSNENGNGKKQYDISKTERSTDYTRKSGDTLNMESVLKMCEKIFDKDEKWLYVILPNKYTEYLIANKDMQTILPKNLYDLIECFKGRDMYAHKMIRSIRYLEALINNDVAKIQSKRVKYMVKKIKESKETPVQVMLMYVRRYMEKFCDWDMTASERAKYASPNIENIMKRAGNEEIKVMNSNAETIASYCVMDVSTNFNDMNYTSLKSILAPKIKEIEVLKPTIAALNFSFVTTD